MTRRTPAELLNDYMAQKIGYIKGLKNPSEMHKLLVTLWDDRNNLNEKEQATLDLLIKSERAEDRAATKRAKVARLLTQKKDDERKARNHRLIQQGLLVDLAELEKWDRGLLLGALLAVKSSPEHRHELWKQNGDAELARREAQQNSASK